MSYPDESLALIHPEFRGRLQALHDEMARRGWRLGYTSTTRTAAVQAVMYAQWRAGLRKASAANPAALGPVSPWGWRQRGSFHMQQQDGWGHAADLNIEDIPGAPQPFGPVTWPKVHDLALGYGVIFPLLHLAVPEAWHAQWWNGPLIAPAPALGVGGPPVPTAPPSAPPGPSAPHNHAHQEGLMYEFIPDRRPSDPSTVDFTYLPGNGATLDGVRTSCHLYVRKADATVGVTAVRVWMNEHPQQMLDGGVMWPLPPDGAPIDLPVVEPGFCSVQAFDADSVPQPSTGIRAVALHQAFYVAG